MEGSAPQVREGEGLRMTENHNDRPRRLRRDATDAEGWLADLAPIVVS